MLSNSITSLVPGQEPSSSTPVDAGGVSAPPASDTGALNTTTLYSCLCDWLAFTKPVDPGSPVADVVSWVFATFGEGILLDRGGLGYTHSAVICETGRVFWSPDRAGQGVHVRLPSTALAWLHENRWTWGTFEEFLRFLLSHGAKFVRADWALDDRAGALDLDTIDRYYKNGWLTCCWRTGHVIEGRLDSCGRTLCFGSRSSDSYMRIYDKVAERASRGVAVDSSHWIRCEVEYKRKAAHESVIFAAFSGCGAIVGLIRGLIEFKEPGEDTNKSRWAPAAWWLDFLGGVEKAHLKVVKAVKTIERVMTWLQTSVAPSLAYVALHFGNIDAIKDFIASGMDRLNPWQTAALLGG